jgi:hypothetical protein
MLSVLAEFPSKHFYKGRLVTMSTKRSAFKATAIAASANAVTASTTAATAAVAATAAASHNTVITPLNQKNTTTTTTTAAVTGEEKEKEEEEEEERGDSRENSNGDEKGSSVGGASSSKRPMLTIPRKHAKPHSNRHNPNSNINNLSSKKKRKHSDEWTPRGFPWPSSKFPVAFVPSRKNALIGDEEVPPYFTSLHISRCLTILFSF